MDVSLIELRNILNKNIFQLGLSFRVTLERSEDDIILGKDVVDEITLIGGVESSTDREEMSRNTFGINISTEKVDYQIFITYDFDDVSFFTETTNVIEISKES